MYYQSEYRRQRDKKAQTILTITAIIILVMAFGWSAHGEYEAQNGAVRDDKTETTQVTTNEPEATQLEVWPASVRDRVEQGLLKQGWSAEEVEVGLRIAECESGLDQYASNTDSTAKGVFMFTNTTWKEINASGHQYDLDESIKQFAIWYLVNPDWWECQ